MHILKRLVSLIACTALCAPAFAASLGAVKGTVLVNRGTGYQTVYGPMELKPGDLVVVDPGGSAQLTFADGCSVAVEVGAVVTIGEKSPCTAPASGPGFGGFGGAGVFMLNAGIAAGAVGLLVASQKNDKPASP